MQVNRRLFMVKAFFAQALVATPFSKLFAKETAESNLAARDWSTGDRHLSDLEAMQPIDVVDTDVSYLKEWENGEESAARSIQLLEQVLSGLKLPENGVVFEVGSYKGQVLEALCQKFGRSRCIGLDIYNYEDHPQKVIQDIREYNEPQRIALGWNQTSKWSTNPRSKHAAFKYLKENLVPGGILVEDHQKWIPMGVDLSGLKVIYEDSHFSVFQKA